SFEAEGFSVWWDATLRSGEAYDQVTEEALRTAKAVVVLWSQKSAKLVGLDRCGLARTALCGWAPRSCPEAPLGGQSSARSWGAFLTFPLVSGGVRRTALRRLPLIAQGEFIVGASGPTSGPSRGSSDP